MTVATLNPVFADIMGAHVALCNLPHGGKHEAKAERAAQKRLADLLVGLSARDRDLLVVTCNAIARRADAI
jgi:hypothetical protein